MHGPTVEELVAMMHAAREREQAADAPPARPAPSREGGEREAPLEVEGHRIKPWSNAGVREEIERRGWAVIDSRTLGEPVLWLRDSGVVVPERWRKYVSYTLAELEALRGATKDELRQIHAAKRAFGGRVLPPGAVSAPREDGQDDAPDAPPAEPCYACGGREWWRVKGGPWICARCHPPAPGVTVAARVTRLPPRSPAGGEGGAA